MKILYIQAWTSLPVLPVELQILRQVLGRHLSMAPFISESRRGGEAPFLVTPPENGSEVMSSLL